MSHHITHDRTLILGVDGGASKTVALLADERGMVLGRAQVGGSYKQVSGVEATLAALRTATVQVFTAAGLPVQTVAAACLGLSGVDRPADHALIQGWAAERRLARTLSVVNDARLLLAAGTPDGHGIGLICGTGSIAFGRTLDGRSARAGGWGYLLGDEGSGYDIALRALRAAAQAADGRGGATRLLGALLDLWELDQAFDLIPFVYNQSDPRARLSEIPPLVSQLADEGDDTAGAILQLAAEELAAAVIAAARQLGLAAPLPLALSGSVILRSPLLHAALCETLSARGYRADPVTPVDDPAYGALRLARDLLSQ
jgi:N-acetylglucosamine kinase-like BadF-type ATPase